MQLIGADQPREEKRSYLSLKLFLGFYTFLAKHPLFPRTTKPNKVRRQMTQRPQVILGIMERA